MEFREYRAKGVATDDNGKLTGLVTPFDRETTIGDLNRGGWTEVVKPGFFTKTLREADYLLVYQHDMSKPMARKSAGNVTFAEGELDGQRGLVMDAEPVDTSYTRDCLNLVRAKVINGMSFGFNVVKDAWFDAKGKPSDQYNGVRRELLEGHLVEGSPVTRPAYGGTAISARDESSALLELRQTASDEEARFAAENALYEENRATPVSTKDRKSLAAKKQALPDGSYPIKDVSHLHAAAVLAASHHGNWQAAKKLIRKMAKKLGVALSTLPGFGGKSGGKSGSRSDVTGNTVTERRIKKSVAKRVVILDTELNQALDLLKSGDADGASALIASSAEHIGHIMHKENLSADDARSEPKPDASTSADDDAALALRMAKRSREMGKVIEFKSTSKP